MAEVKYQYGTSPRKVEPDYNNRKKNKKEKLKVVEDLPRKQIKISVEQRKKQFKLTLTVAAVFLLLLTISCRNSQIDKKFTEIQTQKKELSEIKKENEQLKVSIENSLNLNNIEKVAKEELGMQKLTNKQTVYITLPKKDYIESATEKIITNEQKNWLEELFSKFFNF
jgi:cell division protein FtsL